jgi:hypothetical protein
MVQSNIFKKRPRTKLQTNCSQQLKIKGQRSPQKKDCVPQHKKDGVRYEIITQEDTETGDILVPLPPQLLEELNWKEGDVVDFSLDDQNRYIIKKVVK